MHDNGTDDNAHASTETKQTNRNNTKGSKYTGEKTKHSSNQTVMQLIIEPTTVMHSFDMTETLPCIMYACSRLAYTHLRISGVIFLLLFSPFPD